MRMPTLYFGIQGIYPIYEQVTELRLEVEQLV